MQPFEVLCVGCASSTVPYESGMPIASVSEQQPQRSMSCPDPRRRQRRRGWLIALIVGAGLINGCSSTNPPTTVLRVARTLPGNDKVTSADNARERRMLRIFKANIQEVIPGLHIQPSVYTESAITTELRRQTNSGLGPDLVISDASTIQNLFQANLLEPVPLTQQQRAAVSPSLLKRVTNAKGDITGLPVSQFVQLACYDKRKIRAAPTTLKALAEASGRGQIFGLTQAFEDLYWSMGSFNAGPALVSSLRGNKPTAAQTHQLVQWMTWLRDTSFQQNVMFLRNQSKLRLQLIKGELHWISCWSSQLPELRDALKENLGIDLLPAGPAGKATPISKLQVWGLGRNSSRQQRRSSEELMEFIVQPWAQKTWTLRYRTTYPVNPAAASIVDHQIPGVEDLYLTTAKQGILVGDEIVAALDADAALTNAFQEVLNDVIFGTEPPAKAAAKLHTLLSPST